MSSGHQRIKWRRNIAENFNRLSRVHERYRETDDRQTDRRQTDGRRHIAKMNMSSRSLISLMSPYSLFTLEKSLFSVIDESDLIEIKRKPTNSHYGLIVSVRLNRSD